MKERVGIFGGTFDPPHRGHLQVALSACDELNLDRLLWIPAGTPPHKQQSGLTESRHRVAMTACMADEDERFELELFEVSRGGVSYTVETLEHLSETHPDWTLVLIMGGDQWSSFETWVRPEAIRSLAEIAVYRRAGSESEDPAGAQPDHWLKGALQPESSTAVRERVVSSSAADADVTNAVASYINAHGLYR